MKWWMKIANWLKVRSWKHICNCPIPYVEGKSVKVYSCTTTGKFYAYVGPLELSIGISRERLEELAGLNEEQKTRYSKEIVEISRKA